MGDLINNKALSSVRLAHRRGLPSDLKTVVFSGRAGFVPFSTSPSSAKISACEKKKYIFIQKCNIHMYIKTFFFPEWLQMKPLQFCYPITDSFLLKSRPVFISIIQKLERNLRKVECFSEKDHLSVSSVNKLFRVDSLLPIQQKRWGFTYLTWSDPLIVSLRSGNHVCSVQILKEKKTPINLK